MLANDELKTKGIRITREHIADYLHILSNHGYKESTVKAYKRNLVKFYNMLPDEKKIYPDTLARWQDRLMKEGYMPRTINLISSSVNGFFASLKLWEFQTRPHGFEFGEDKQPEITRVEYLRLLSAARMMGKHQTYLLVKLFATTDITVQQLPHVTVDAVKAGQVYSYPSGLRRCQKIPKGIRAELISFASQNNISSGPIFITRTGKNLNRTAVTGSIQKLSRAARVDPEKCNPRCLRKLYQATMENINDRLNLFAEREHDRILEQEQSLIQWEAPNIGK